MSEEEDIQSKDVGSEANDGQQNKEASARASKSQKKDERKKRSPANRQKHRFEAIVDDDQDMCLNLIIKILSEKHTTINSPNQLEEFQVAELRKIMKIFKLMSSDDKISNKHKNDLVVILFDFLCRENIREKFPENLQIIQNTQRIQSPSETYQIKSKPKKDADDKSQTSSAQNKQNKDTENEEKSDDSEPEPLVNISNFPKFAKCVPSTVEDFSSAVRFINNCNEILWKMSERVSELERAVSILLVRITEAEKKFGIKI